MCKILEEGGSYGVWERVAGEGGGGDGLLSWVGIYMVVIFGVVLEWVGEHLVNTLGLRLGWGVV